LLLGNFASLPVRGDEVSSASPRLKDQQAARVISDNTKAEKNLGQNAEKWTVKGSLRFRYEFTDNYDRKSFGTGGDDGFLLGRLLLNFGYRFDDRTRAALEFQDARVWDSNFSAKDDGYRSPDRNPLDVRQAFIEYKGGKRSRLGWKVGRQTISYGDNRIMGPGEWGNVGNYLWDAAVLKFRGNSGPIDAFFARRVRPDSRPWRLDTDHYDFAMSGIYATLRQKPALVDLFFIHKEGDSPWVCGGNRIERERRNTLGLRIDGKVDRRFDVGGLYARQDGTWGTRKIRSYAWNGRLGYTFDTPWRLRIGGEIAYASGDDNPKDNVHSTFDSVFGARDKLYGRMNLLGWSNLDDRLLTLKVTPTPKLDVMLDYHFFRLAEARDCWYYSPSKSQGRDPTGAAGRDLGRECDLILDSRLSQNTSLTAIFGVFQPGTFCERIGKDGDARWGCLQATLSF